MSIDQLIGRYFRLQQELAAASGSLPWNTGHIDRLTDELSTTERELSAAAAQTPVYATLTATAFAGQVKGSAHAARPRT